MGAGHAPHWQRPEKFNKLLLEFLNDARQGK
jgi:pimeloyl-ACP methyl ester carboxylesterase